MSQTLAQHRQLGTSDVRVPPVIFGAWAIGGWMWGGSDEQDAVGAIRASIDHGVNAIDTAAIYGQGNSEEIVGRALRGVPRDKVIIATKCGRRWDSAEGSDPWSTTDFHGKPITIRSNSRRESIFYECEQSLKRLGTDYIDLYQIHWPQRNVPMFGGTRFDPSKEKGGPAIREQVEGMAAMMAAGKIRHYGLSNETTWGVCEFHRVAKELGVPGPATLQNSYSLLSRNVDNDLAEALFREGMSLLAYSPLAGGLLTGKYLNGAKPKDARFTLFDSLGARFRKSIVPEAIDAYAALAKRRDLTLVQLALGYVASRWFLGSSIIGATSMAQLKEDIAAAQITLDAETLREVEDVLQRYPNPAP